MLRTQVPGSGVDLLGAMSLMSFLAFERRWIETILPSFLGAPSEGAQLTVSSGEVDWVGAATEMHRGSNGRAKVGFRLAVWAVYFSPLWMGAGAVTLAGLPMEARAALLDRMSRHDVFAVRGMTLLLKLAVSLAIFVNDEVRVRSGYERTTTRFDPVRRGLPVFPSGLRAPRSTLSPRELV